MEKQIRVTQLLFYLNAAIWLIFGLISLYRLQVNTVTNEIAFLVIASLMFGNVAMLLISGYVLKWPHKRWFWLVTAVLLINIVLTFTDQVGIFDLITLLIDLLSLSFLVVNREWFWRTRN